MEKAEMDQKYPPYMTVIICTYNRSEYLRELLDCLLAQDVSGEFDYEIIIADNNSGDGTQEMVESYVPRFGGKLHYLFEPRQGKPFALNSAIMEAKGKILVFTDDDCLVQSDFLSLIHQVYEEYGETVDFTGGKIFPHWMGGKCPSWLAEVIFDERDYDLDDKRYWRRVFFRGPLSILDYGRESVRVDRDHERYEAFLFYGPNMTIRKSAVDKVEGYALDKFITQDTEICLRLIRAHMKGLYTPEVIVFHRVHVEELTPKFYRQWYYGRGKYSEVVEDIEKKFYHPLGIRNAFIARTIKLFLKSIKAKTIQEKIHYRCQGFFNIGQMVQIARKNLTCWPQLTF